MTLGMTLAELSALTFRHIFFSYFPVWLSDGTFRRDFPPWLSGNFFIFFSEIFWIFFLNLFEFFWWIFFLIFPDLKTTFHPQAKLARSCGSSFLHLLLLLLLLLQLHLLVPVASNFTLGDSFGDLLTDSYSLIRWRSLAIFFGNLFRRSFSCDLFWRYFLAIIFGDLFPRPFF